MAARTSVHVQSSETWKVGSWTPGVKPCCWLSAQCEITRNVKTLLDANFHRQGNGGANPSAEEMALMKIYMRDPDLFPMIKEEWENKLGWKGPAIYLLGDICRRELLLEIEGIWLIRR